jgi:biopolymer transport protein ExbD
MTLLTLLPLSLGSVAFAAEGPVEAPKTVDYKRADTNFYAKGDVLKADPGATILPPTSFAQNGDTYTFTPKKKAPKTIYVEAPSDWIEPITPPDMPASLEIAPDAMQIREPQGDVQIALPNAPASFSPVTDGMTVPNGAVVKTGTNATAAILFGGVDSARLMPDSEAAVQQTVTATTRSTEVDLTAGGVFSKVGTQLGVASEYQVHTPFGTAIAPAGDFAAVIVSSRTDVWVARGTVELLQPDGKKYGIATADGTGPLKLIRFPAIANPVQSFEADAESLTSVLNFIPVADQKLAALHAKQARGTPLTANEDAYLQRITQVPALIKLALVEPPPPPPAPTPPPVPVAPIAAAPAPTEVITLPAAPTANPGDMEYAVPGHTGPLPGVVVHANGTILFQNTTSGLKEFQTEIADFAKANPTQSVVLISDPKVSHAKVQAVIDACKKAHVPQVAIAPPATTPPLPPPAPTPAVPAIPSVAATVAPPEPLIVIARADGSIKFQGATMKIAEFQEKIKAAIAAHPDQAVIIHSNPKMDYARFAAVLDACKAAPAKEIAVTPPAPQPPPAAPPAARPAAPPAPAAPAPAVAAIPGTPASTNPDVTTIPGKASTPLEPLTVLIHEDGSVGFEGKRGSLADFKTKLAATVQATPDRELVIKASSREVPYDHVKAVLDACADAHVAHVTINPATAEPLPVTAETPPAPPVPVNDKPVPAEIDLAADGTLTLDGSPVTEDDLKSKLADIKKTNPKNPLVMMKQSKVTKDQWKHYVDLCHSMGLKLLVKDAKPPAAAPLPVTAETPPNPALANPQLSIKPPQGVLTEGNVTYAGSKPLGMPAIVKDDGTIVFNRETMDLPTFKKKAAAYVKTHPDEILFISSGPKLPHDKFEAIMAAAKAAHPKKVETAPDLPTAEMAQPPEPPFSVPPAPSVAPVTFPASASEQVPVNNKPVPAEIGLAADGTLTLDGSSITEDDLKSKLADIKKTNPKNPLVMRKQRGVTKDQWMHYVDLCHSMGLKLLVKDVKTATPPPTAETPPTPRPSAAEGGSTEPPPLLTPHLSASPAPAAPPPSPSAQDSVPVEIELTPDGQISFLGEVISESDLKSRLDNVSQANADEPVLIVKDEKVTHDQWQKVVDICHAAKLKVKLKTVKSSDSGALKPRAHNAAAIAALPPPAAPSAAGAAPLAAPKILPVEIDLATKGRLTLEGTSVSVDELEARLSRFATANPKQPILIVRNNDVPDDSVDALVTLCRSVNPHFKVAVKTVNSFLPSSSSMDADGSSSSAQAPGP